MTMLTPGRLQEIEKLSIIQRPVSLQVLAETRRLALVDLLADREQLLARIAELEKFIQTGDDVAE